MIKILCVILSCQKNKHLWYRIKTKGIPSLVIITGGRDCGTNFYKLNDDILELNCNDYYEGLPGKIISAIDAILTIEDFNDITHILKIDDHDNEFTNDNIKFLRRSLEEATSPIFNKDYIGQRIQKKSIVEHSVRFRRAHFSKVSIDSHWADKLYTGPYVDFVHGGCSYILSRKAMECIKNTYSYKDISKISNIEIFEDVMVAKILDNSGIKPVKFIYGVKGDKPNYTTHRKLILR